MSGFDIDVAVFEERSDPPAAANKGRVFTKDVAGVTEMFYQDDTGVVVQISLTGGGVVSGGGGGGSQQYSGTDVSDTWLCPAGVFQVTIWAMPGAGGGSGGARGGNGFTSGATKGGGGGGGRGGAAGGSCGLVPANLTVVPGTTYTRLIGAGGAGGAGGTVPNAPNLSGIGGDGAATKFLDGATLLCTWGKINTLTGAVNIGGQSTPGQPAATNGSFTAGGATGAFIQSGIPYGEGNVVAGSSVNGGVYAQNGRNAGIGGAGGTVTGGSGGTSGSYTAVGPVSVSNIVSPGRVFNAGPTAVGGAGAGALWGGGGAGSGGGVPGGSEGPNILQWGFPAQAPPIPPAPSAGGAGNSVTGVAGVTGANAPASSGGYGGCGGSGGGGGGAGGVGGAGGNGGAGGAGSGGRMIVTWIGA